MITAHQDWRRGTSTTTLIALVVTALLLVAVFVAPGVLRARRTEVLRTRIGDTEYDRTVKDIGCRVSQPDDVHDVVSM